MLSSALEKIILPDQRHHLYHSSIHGSTSLKVPTHRTLILLLPPALRSSSCQMMHWFQSLSLNTWRFHFYSSSHKVITILPIWDKCSLFCLLCAWFACSTSLFSLSHHHVTRSLTKIASSSPNHRVSVIESQSSVLGHRHRGLAFTESSNQRPDQEQWSSEFIRRYPLMSFSLSNHFKPYQYRC